MLQDIKQFYGIKLGATDGVIGEVKDFYFDDLTWTIRYLVADTGTWLSGRQVLLSPHAFGHAAFGKFDPESKILAVKLTRQQIENSPSIDRHRPVSRQHEEEYYRYYGWPVYWDAGAMGMPIYTAVAMPTPVADRPHHGHNQRDDIHLRSLKAITGYQIQATDGPIGKVIGFMVHGHSWTIRELVVETGHWYEGKPILVLARNVTRISYEDSTVFVNLTKDDLAKTDENDVAHAGGSHD